MELLIAIPLALAPVGIERVLAQEPAAAVAPAQPLSAAELEQILAPIALYPDDLLTQILMASTYPLEVVMADRWLQQPGHRALKGEALVTALGGQDWDASVKSLIPFASVLATMSGRLEWTQRLGDAFLAQPSDVFAAVQTLRGRAQAAGALATNAQQTVTKQATAIVIQPTQPSVVYVPAYDPGVVYGAWPSPAYPPVSYPPPPGANIAGALATGLAFGTGIAITSALWGWGRPNWGGGHVDVDVNRFNSINVNRTSTVNRAAATSNVWRHNADHRRGVAYSNAQARQAFQPRPAGDPGQREAFRGRAPAGQPVARAPGAAPGAAAGRPGLARTPDRPPGAQKLQRPPAAGGGAVQRPQNAQRPAGGSGAFHGAGNGSAARAQAAQGRASRAGMAHGGGGAPRGGGQRGGQGNGGHFKGAR